MEHRSESQQSAPSSSRTHAVLIGIDDYTQAPLRGCVNDAEAMRAVLVEKRLVSASDVVLLASPSNDRRVPNARGPAIAADIRLQLARLAKVQPGDRIFIYYSGHGASVRSGGRVARQHEALLPQDAALPGNKLFDYEVNALLSRIAARTAHVTVILDCCHSAGATRALWESDDPSSRSCLVDVTVEELHALSALESSRDLAGIGGPTHDSVLVLAACAAEEVAIERTFEDGRRHGVFTRALLDALAPLASERFRTTAWRDLWAQVISAVAPNQHPRVVGNDARVLDGRNVSLEAGALSVRPDEGAYRISAGVLADITPGTLIDVKSSSPLEPGSTVLGSLHVVSATQREATAEATRPFVWPAQPLCRVTRYGDTVLQLAVRGELGDEIDELLGSEVARVPEPGDVLLVRDGRDWVLCDELFGLAKEGRPELTRVAPSQLPAALRHMIGYRAPLRLAKRCTDLPGVLRLQALDMTKAGLVSVSTELEELRQANGAYLAPAGVEFCLEVFNAANVVLNVTLLNVARSGRVQFCEAFSLMGLVHHRLWFGGVIGRPFRFSGAAGFERIVAIATTDPDASFRHLELSESFTDAVSSHRDAAPRDLSDSPRVDPLLWTATYLVFDTRFPAPNPEHHQ